MSQQSPDVYTGSTAPGSSTMPNIKDALNAIVSMHSGASEPSYKVQGTWWYDTTNDHIKWYDGSAWVKVAEVDEAGDSLTLFSDGAEVLTSALTYSEGTFTDGDTTPSVSSQKTIYKTANTSATTITTFDDGSAGQFFTLLCNDANTTVDGGLTKTGMTIPLVSGDTLTFMYDGSGWKQTDGSVGMGQFVPVEDPDAIGDWISGSTTTFTDVDVSDDGVRKGAVAVLFTLSAKSPSLAATLRIRKNGSSVDDATIDKMRVSTIWNIALIEAALDNDAKFEARFDTDWSTSTHNDARVVGYYI